MLTIGGLLLVFVAVIGGYLLERGNLMVLVQPAELVIIGGAALGALLAGNSPRVIGGILKGLKAILSGERYDQRRYLQTLKMLYDLFSSARKNGAVRLEADIENPSESPIFSEHPEFVKDEFAKRYLCDTLRLVLMGGVAVHELEQLMDLDGGSHSEEAGEPVAALHSVAEALPGLGIVAAVLGVVITMGALGGPAAEIGHRVAAALVGTFLGVLLCYGFVGPIAHRLESLNHSEDQYLTCLRQAILAYFRGSGPLVAAEFGRRSIPPHVRPSFQEFEEACKGPSAAPVEEEAAA